jgi:hypothetical protein
VELVECQDHLERWENRELTDIRDASERRVYVEHPDNLERLEQTDIVDNPEKMANPVSKDIQALPASKVSVATLE